MNKLYSEMMGNSSIINRFHEFARTFKGDPKAEVERLIRSGQISQRELNELQQQATQLMQLLNVSM